MVCFVSSFLTDYLCVLNSHFIAQRLVVAHKYVKQVIQVKVNITRLRNPTCGKQTSSPFCKRGLVVEPSVSVDLEPPIQLLADSNPLGHRGPDHMETTSAQRPERDSSTHRSATLTLLTVFRPIPGFLVVIDCLSCLLFSFVMVSPHHRAQPLPSPGPQVRCTWVATLPPRRRRLHPRKPTLTTTHSADITPSL